MVVEKGYKQTEVGVIPENWSVIKIGDFIEFKNGLNKDKKFFGYGTPIINYMDVYNSGGINPKEILGKVFLNKSEISAYQAKKGDVFFTRTSETVEEIGISSVLLEDSLNTVFSGFVLRGREKTKILSNDFKKYCFSERSVRNQIISSASYTTRALTNGRLLSQVLLKVPPIHEQTAIASALSEMDQLIAQTEKLIEKKKAIKQGVMQELLRPKEGWVTKRLGEIAVFRRGSFPQPYGLDKWYDDIAGKPFVQVYDVDENKKLKPETKRYISEAAQKMSVFAKKGTIILTIQGSIGRIAITQYDAYVDRTLLIFESFKYEFDTYFFMNIIHQLFEIEKQSAPGGIIKTITKDALSIFNISYPDFYEQCRIGEIISDLENDIVTTEKKLQKLKLQKQGMMQALLTGKIRLV